MKTVFALFFAAIAAVSRVVAQPPETPQSHLTCFTTIPQDLPYKSKVQLLANRVQIEYSLKKCKVNYKKIDLCVPSTKDIIDSNTQFPDILYDIAPQRIKNDFLCYKLNCKPQDPTHPQIQNVVDQFGVKKLRFPKTQAKICVPGWKMDGDLPIVIG